jgi:hypothetical protein
MRLIQTRLYHRQTQVTCQGMGQLAVIQTHVPRKIVFFAWSIQSLFSLLWLQYLSVENIWICLASERQGYWQGKSNRNSMRVI